MERVLIEFYSEKTPENLISILNEQFASVFFLYSTQSYIPSLRRKNALSELVRRTLGFDANFCEVKSRKLSDALEALNALMKENTEYLIDITGGDESFIAAAGIFCEQNQGRVTLHQYDVSTAEKLFSYPANGKDANFFPHYVSVPYLLSLNGSIPLSVPSYSFSKGSLKAEILRLWNIAKQHPKEWNRFCALSRDDKGKSQSITKKVITPGIDANSYYRISSRLKSIGVLSDEKKTHFKGRDYMEFSLNVPPEARFLYDKAGNVLEMFCALCAHESDLFHDIRVGVMMDWDGKLSQNRSADPYNEVDLIFMRENLPIVGSCKNTTPKNDHLYEIMIMAKHYGGFYSTPALFSSGKATESVRKRAEEMGIVLIDGIRHKTPEEMTRLISKRFKTHQTK